MVIQVQPIAHVNPGSWKSNTHDDREAPIEIQGTHGTLNVAILARGFWGLLHSIDSTMK